MNDNPYQASSTPVDIKPVGTLAANKIEVRIFSRFSDALKLMGDQYLLFVGIWFVALLINAVVPLNIMLGPMLCGTHLCFNDRIQGRSTKFEQLFKGFDFFMPSFIACLILLFGGFLLAIPMMLSMVGAMMSFSTVAEYGFAEPLGVAGVAVCSVLFFLFMLATLVFYLPFIFAFALIVDQKLDAMPALWAGYDGAKKNLWGLVGMLVVTGIIGMACAMACYVPVFFVLPIQAGAFYLVYRDIFPNAAAPKVSPEPASPYAGGIEQA